MLRHLELREDHRTPIRELSKGNAQKVALAQAVLTTPTLLVLDEPWSGLDAAAHAELSTIISDVAASGGVVVFTNHRGETTQRNASVRFHLREGRLARADVTAVIAAAALTCSPAATSLPRSRWTGDGRSACST